MLSTLSVVALVCAEEGSGTAGRELAGLAVERVAAEMAEATEEVLEDCDPGRTLEDSCCVRLCLSSSRKRRDLRASYDSERGWPSRTADIIMPPDLGAIRTADQLPLATVMGTL